MSSESTTVNVVNQAIADPSAIGLASFGIGLFTLSFFNAGILGPNAISVLIPTALFAALLHFVTAYFGFKKNELFTALVFGVYGMFWAVWGILNLGCALKWYELDANTLLVFLIAYTIFTAIILVATLVTNMAVIITIALLLAVFVCLDLALAGIIPEAGVWAGYIGIVDALMALYVCAAIILNTLYGRTVLGVGPIKS